MLLSCQLTETSCVGKAPGREQRRLFKGSGEHAWVLGVAGFRDPRTLCCPSSAIAQLGQASMSLNLLICKVRL